MRLFFVTMGLIVAMFAHAVTADAAVINGQNWADDVKYHSSKIQNFKDWELMTSSTKWWVTGKSDADPNGNDIFDPGEPDYLGGWRQEDSGEYIIVEFDDGLVDVVGNDLTIRMFCGSIASANVFGSVDNSEGSYVQLGSIVGQQGQVPGKPKYFYDAEFDFNGALNNVHYVKVERVTIGSGSGMFFDSFASTPVPEPTTLLMLVLGSILVVGRLVFVRRRACQ